MDLDDLTKFSTVLNGMGELYGKTISELLMDIYWQVLKRFELPTVLQAFEFHINHPDKGQYFPRPSDIVRFIEGSEEDRALQAWTTVVKAITQVGVYRTVVFDDPLIHAVIEDMGGWVKLCEVRFDELSFRAQEFQKRYKAFIHKAPKRYPKYCCGIIEGENARRGYPIAPHLIVGDLKKAEQVMLTGGGLPLLVHSGELIEQVMKQLPQPNANIAEEE